VSPCQGALTATSGRSKERKEAICNASIMLGKIWKKAGEIPWETWKFYEIVRFLEGDPDPPTISRKFRALPRLNLSAEPPDSRNNTPEGKTDSKRFDFPTTFHRPHPTDLPEFPSCNGNGPAAVVLWSSLWASLTLPGLDILYGGFR
jgi:hypothetical protein